MSTIYPKTGDILSQLKTFKTLCTAFSVRVRELVRKLNGEYGLCSQGIYSLYICTVLYTVRKGRLEIVRQFCQ